MRYFLVWCFLLVLIPSCQSDENPPDEVFQLLSIRVGTVELQANSLVVDIPVGEPVLLRFNQAVDRSTVGVAILLTDQGVNVPASINYLDNDQTVSLAPNVPFNHNNTYQIEINELASVNGQFLSLGPFDFQTIAALFSASEVKADDQDLKVTTRVQNVSTTPTMEINFEEPLASGQLLDELVTLANSAGSTTSLQFALDQTETTLTVTANSDLAHISKYNLIISDELTAKSGALYEGSVYEFYTDFDSIPKFPELPLDDLLTTVQQQTFKYFWDFAHPVSGLARERNTSGDLVTSGGSGFGLMAIIVGIERAFISREDGIQRISTIVDFLSTAQRFHGVWSHWLNGNDGTVIPFSQFDDGGDLVETSYLIQGLLTVRQYLNPLDATEATIIADINTLWEQVEWDWYTQEGQNQLYWHYSDNFQWRINLAIRGYNEALITYILAAGSPTHSIEPEVYHQGWANNGSMVNGNEYLGHVLPLGQPLGGPLFFSHYTFLSIDPRNLQDDYANYWTQNVNHSLINYQYCQNNTGDYVGYGGGNWGLTASDNHIGYSAHSPTNDLGVITPTAALSSIPFTPEQSIAALNHFYYIMGDQLWGDYGFYDAFNLTEEWVADSYLAIDQGPIIIMIENYRTGLLWDLFMSAPEVQSGLDRLNFTY